MIVALSVLLGAAIGGWWGPRLLRRAARPRTDPLVLVVGWCLSITGVLIAVATGVALLLSPTHGSTDHLAALFQHCWTAVQHGSPPDVEHVGGLIAAGILLALTIRTTVIGQRARRRRSEIRRGHTALLRTAARSDAQEPRTLWLAHDQPLAFSIGGKQGVVVVTEGLFRHLDDDSVAAVLAHEHAHLHGRHHLLIALADALRDALPFVPLFRQAPVALRQLVELVADVAAVRTCGVAAVRAALLGISGRGVPDWVLTMARDAVDIRLARLDAGIRPPGRIRRFTSCTAAGLGLAVLPFLAAATIFSLVGAVACPMIVD